MNTLDTLNTAAINSATNDSHYHSLSIAQAIRMIQANEIALPLLQRDLVWEAGKALSLFDSVMQSYPINSMLLWDVRKENVGQVPMYSFIRHYTTYLGSDSLLGALHNNKQVPTENLVQNAEKGQLLAVLDGQQRLASFYMGLTGTYAWRAKHKWDSKADSFEPRQLFLQLSDRTDEAIPDNLEERPLYRLKWQRISPGAVEVSPDTPRLFRWDNKKNELWLRAGAVLDYQLTEHGLDWSAEDWAASVLSQISADVMLSGEPNAEFEAINQPNFQEAAQSILVRLHKAIHEERHVCYYLLDKKTELHTALATFVRINSGGMTLSAADLLFSALSTRWTSENIRDVLKGLEQRLKQFAPYLHQTFILKTALAMVSAKNLPVSLSNFKAEYIQLMKENWLPIESALLQAASIVFEPQSDFNSDPLAGRPICIIQNPSLFAALAYYCYKAQQANHTITTADKQNMRRWLIKAKLTWWDKQAAAETKLSNVMRVINQAARPESDAAMGFPFPYAELCDAGLVADGPNLWISRFASERIGEGLCIEELLKTRKGDLKTRFLLGLTQSNVHDDETYEVDHCFPYRECRDTEDEEWQTCADSLPNLQLLESRLNSSKKDRPFKDWYAELPEFLEKSGMPERLQASTRQEFALAHGMPYYLATEQDEDKVTDAKSALVQFHDARQVLLRERLEKALLEPQLS